MIILRVSATFNDRVLVDRDPLVIGMTMPIEEHNGKMDSTAEMDFLVKKITTELFSKVSKVVFAYEFRKLDLSFLDTDSMICRDHCKSLWADEIVKDVSFILKRMLSESEKAIAEAVGKVRWYD